MATTGLPVFVGIVLGIVAISTYYWQARIDPDWNKPQIPSALLQSLTASLAVRFHAARRFGRWCNGSFSIFSPPYCLHLTHTGRWWVCSTGSSGYSSSKIFDSRGRILGSGAKPIRFALQRMCRRLVVRTRRRIECRVHLDPYLIPDLVHITASYI